MFDFMSDKKTITIILVVLLLLWLVRAGTGGVLNLLLTVPGLLIALTFHEFAHAYAADKLGDDTPRLQGRLNLNPISHVEPIGLVMLIVAGFGWGRPVQINPRNFNGKYSLSKAEAIVAAAGPIMNILLAFIFLIIYYILIATNILASLTYQWQNIVLQIIVTTVSMNVGLGIFNLIPVPPLDGSKILMHFLPANKKEWFYNNERIFYIVFLLLVLTNLASVIITPIITGVLSGMDWIVYNIFALLKLI